MVTRDEVIKLIDEAEEGKEGNDNIKGIQVVKVFESDDIQASDKVCDKDGNPVESEGDAGAEPATGDEEEKKAEGDAGAEPAAGDEEEK